MKSKTKIKRKVLSVLTAFAVATAMMPAVILAEQDSVAAGTSAAMEFKITVPSDEERVIAPKRNFYVIGQGDDLKSKDIKVEITDSEGDIVRSLQRTAGSGVTADKASCLPVVDSDYPTDHAERDSLFGDDYNNLCMPDLMCDAQDNKNPNVKIAVTENNFAALILGGGDNGGLDSQGSDLTAGKYTIKVTATFGSGTTAETETLSKSITIANTQDKVMSRFSPDSHLEMLKKVVEDRDYRMYLDPLPGYWSPNSIPIYYNGSVIGSGAFMEILPRWRKADSMEYESGNVHFYIYNVKKSCATQSVEMGTVQNTNRVDTDLKCYYYNIGEPELLVNGTLKRGSFTAFKAKDKLQFTRAEKAADTGTDNKLVTYKNFTGSVDYKLSDGVCGDKGQEISFYGVAAPIQNTKAQITKDDKNAYTIGNMINKIKYTFVKDGKTVLTASKDVELMRDFETTWTNNQSIYEFKHNFTLTGKLGAGLYKVTAKSIDSNGKVVSGGTEKFDLRVGPKPKKGTTYKIGAGIYKMTKSAYSGGKVTLVKPDKRTYKKLSLPKSVSIKGYRFDVTGIAGKCFYKNSKLKKITVDTKKLTNVGKNALKGINKKAVIKVPGSKYKAYKKLFKNKGQSSSVRIVKK